MVSVTEKSAARKALDYAEEELGVHAVYEQAKADLKLLNEQRVEMANLRHNKAACEAEISYRELEIRSDELAKHSEMSVAAMERHLKDKFHGDPSLASLRADLAAFNQDIGMKQTIIDTLADSLKISTARMTELGGYLQYLAVIKTANIAK